MDLDLLEEIDLSSDQDEIEVIRGDVAVLNRYYDEISAAGGVSRDQAKILVRDCNVQFDGPHQINSFTEVPSRTNLSVAMEGMFSSAFRSVWELIKKAAALMMKIIRWIINAIRKGLGLKRDTAKAVVSTKAIRKINDKFAAASNSTVTTPGIMRALQELIDTQVSYDSNFNDLVADFLTNGEFAATVRNIGIELLPYHEVMEAKIALFYDLVTGPLNQGDAAAIGALTGQLNTIATPMEAQRIQGYLKNAGVKFDGKTMWEALHALRAEQSERRGSRSISVISPETAMDHLESHSDTFTAPFVQDMDRWLKILDRINHSLSRLAQAHPSGMISQELVNTYARTFDVVDKEVQSMRQFIVVAEACRTVRDQVAHDLFEISKAEMRVTKERIQAAGDRALKADLHRDLSKFSSVIHG